MSRNLLVIQEKGGVGKTVVARALAEAVPDAPVLEIDSSPRMVELGKRVQFFRRVAQEDIERTGGRAARAEFDPLIEAMARATAPTIVDVGANIAVALLTVLNGVGPDLYDMGIAFGALVVVTSEPGALTEAPRLMDLAKPIAAQRFLLENRHRGTIDAEQLARIADGATLLSLDEQVMEEKAGEFLQDGGLASIARLDPKSLNESYGVALGLRIRRDLTRFRLAAMQAVEPAAQWLVA